MNHSRTYRKFYNFFSSNSIKNNGIFYLDKKNLGELVYKYSSKETCNITYSNFRNQYTILNLPELIYPKDIIKIKAYLDFNKDTINFVNVTKLDPKLQPIYSRIFSNSSNKLNSNQRIN